MIIFLAIAAVIALVIVGAIYSAKWERERREAFSALAGRIGLSFDPGDSSHHIYHTHFGVFSRGYARRAYNTLRGAIDLDDAGRRLVIVAGDYSYKEDSGSGKDRRTTTYNLSYLIVRPSFAFTQRLELRREGIFDKLAATFGFEDIDFESAEFSRKFMVKCDDRKFCYDLFDPRMIQWMLEVNPPTAVSSGMGELLIARGSGRWKPEEFEAGMQWSREFFTRWPRHLLSRLETAASPPPLPRGNA